MSFRGRSFRPRPFTRPPRGGRGGTGVRGNFRFPGPEPYAGRPTESSHNNYPVNERAGFEERDKFHRARSPDREQFAPRTHSREFADNKAPYNDNSSSYYSRGTRTIDYGHKGSKVVPSSDNNHGKTDPWSTDQFTEQRHYSTERHHSLDKPMNKVTPSEVEVDQSSKVVAVEKAMEMAQRTREMISRLGGLKQMPPQSEGPSLQRSSGFSVPDTNAAASGTESAAISKIRHNTSLNTSLVKYAFNLPVEMESTKESAPSLPPTHDVKSSRPDSEQKYGSTYESLVPDHSRESMNYTVTNIPPITNYEASTSMYSQQSSQVMPPKVTQESTKSDSCDPTIANILKSIGFNFELSNMMQDKARKETVSSSVSSSSPSSTETSYPSRVPSFYEERANRYRAEQMTQHAIPDSKESLHLRSATDNSANKLPHATLQQNNDDKTFEDMFKESPAGDFKLKFKASDANAGKKSGALYEDFSDSDDDFTATANVNANTDSKPNPGLVTQNTPNMAAFVKDSVLQQTTTNDAADDMDWKLSTEEFIRKLQEPRPPQRTVTVVPVSDSAGCSVAAAPVHSEHVDADASELYSDNFKLSKSFVPLEELKTIRKTIIVSEIPAKSEPGVGRTDSSSVWKSAKNSHADSSNREKTPKLQQRSESSSRSTERGSVDSSHKKRKRSDPDERDDLPNTSSKSTKLGSDSSGRDRQKRIDALLRELENLKRQQNILMRRKKREKDAHKDPFLMENSKLQEEICDQIDKLRKASQEAVDSSKSPKTFDQSRGKDEIETDSRSRARSSRSVSPEGRDNRNYRSKSTSRNTDASADRQPRVRRIDVHYEYFDSGNHFCRCCNCFSVNIFEHCQHLISSAHQQNVDPFDKPWLKLASKSPPKPAVPKGKITSARIRGVEFLMSTQAFYCSLCDVFLGSCTCAETHCKTDEHNSKYAKYLDDNPYYERRLELEKSSSSAVTGKPLPASMKSQTSSSYSSSSKDLSLVAALEKAKIKVREMAKQQKQEPADIDAELLYPTFKKSRVVPKSSPGVLTEIVSSRQLEDDDTATDGSSKKKSDTADAASVDEEGATAVAESQKHDAEHAETNRTKKSLPFIGKLPFLKTARAAKQAASEQNTADDKSKIEIKLNIAQTMTTMVQSEAAQLYPSPVTIASPQHVAPQRPVCMPSSNVEYSSTDKQNSLDAFLSIGDPESSQCQAVPVLNVGPQTRSEFMLENPPSSKQTAEATKTTGKDTEIVNSASDAVQSMKDVMTMDVKAVATDKATGDVQFSSTTAAANLSSAKETVCTGSLSVKSKTTVTEISSVSEPQNVDAAGSVDTSMCLAEHENNSAMSIEVDDNTEDYEPKNDTETGRVARIARDEETAKLLPQLSATWMEPAASEISDEAAMMCGDFEILDECDADD